MWWTTFRTTGSFRVAAAVCHHGGAGTVAAGLRSGRPTVVVPFFGDQFLLGADRRRVRGQGRRPRTDRRTHRRFARRGDHLRAPAGRADTGPGARREDPCAVRTRGGGLAAFYRQLPLAAMRCSLDAAHLARRQCDDCGLAFCPLCDAVVHEDPARASHRRHLIGHATWGRLGVALAAGAAGACGPRGCSARSPRRSGEPEREPSATRVAIRADSAAAKLHERVAPVVVDAPDPREDPRAPRVCDAANACVAALGLREDVDARARLPSVSSRSWWRSRW
jgi:hypothetical protein